MIAKCRRAAAAATVIVAAAVMLGAASLDEAVCLLERLLGIETRAYTRAPP